jgi:hypothetical protein
MKCRNCGTEIADKAGLPGAKLVARSLSAEISAAVEQTIYAQNESAPSWMKLWYYPYLDDEEFGRLLRQLGDQWEQKAFRIPEEILHVSGLFLRFSELGLYSKNVALTLQDCKIYIDDLGKSWTDVELQQPIGGVSVRRHVQSQHRERDAHRLGGRCDGGNRDAGS